MTITYDGEYVDTVVAEGVALIEGRIKGVDAMLGKTAAGMEEPRDEDLAAFFFQQQKMYPPEPFTFPDGRTVVASPWILALGFCEDGDTWIRRFERFINRNGGA